MTPKLATTCKEFVTKFCDRARAPSSCRRMKPTGGVGTCDTSKRCSGSETRQRAAEAYSTDSPSSLRYRRIKMFHEDDSAKSLK